jgi:hypothetical protein
MEELRNELEELQVKYDGSQDEQERQMAQFEEDFEKKLEKIEKDSEQQLSDVQADCDQKIDDLTGQLNKLRRAMTGDACGWVAKKDSSGDAVFENTETGESSYEKPEVLNFAQTIQKIEESAGDKEKLKKMEEKTKDTEAKKREADVKYNESRAETQNLRGLNTGWKQSAEVIYYSLIAFDQALAEAVDGVQQRSDYVAERSDTTLVQTREGVALTTVKVAELQGVIYQRELEVRRLSAQVERVVKMLKRADAEIALLKESMEVQIERVAAPLRDELAASYTLLMQEKAGREDDRMELADLWPLGWLMPTILQKYRASDDEMRGQKRAAAEEADAERRIKMDIRTRVLEATKWRQGYDDYGRALYIHGDSGDQVWDPPAAMSYTPPKGRDELGNKVDPNRSGGGSSSSLSGGSVRRSPSSRPKEKQSEGKAAAAAAADHGWEVAEDEWGQSFFKNSNTGEEAWERPEEMGPEDAEGGGSVAAKVEEVPFAVDLDPRTRAVYSARCIIDWLRTGKDRQDKADDKDDDFVLPAEGEPWDDEGYMYDMRSVEEVAAGDDNWQYVYEPPDDSDDEDSDDDDDDDDDDDNAEGGEDGEGAGGEGDEKRQKIPILRQQVFDAAVEEEELETKLQHSRRKVERLSKLLIDRIHEVEKEEKEALIPKDSALDDAAREKVTDALAALEASMAAAAAAFDTIGPADTEAAAAPVPTVEEMTEPHESTAASRPSAPVDADTLFAELNHRRLVDATLPRGRVSDEAIYEMAAEAVWSGLSGQAMREQPKKRKGSGGLEEEEDWRARAFFARGEEADDAMAAKAAATSEEEDDDYDEEEPNVSVGTKPLLLTLRRHENLRIEKEKDAVDFAGARAVALRDAHEEGARSLAHAAEDTARVAHFYYPESGTAYYQGEDEHRGGGGGDKDSGGPGYGDGRSEQRRRQKQKQQERGGVRGFSAAPDEAPDRWAEKVVKERFPDPVGDKVRMTRLSKKRDRTVKALLKRDARGLEGSVMVAEAAETPLEAENDQKKNTLEPEQEQVPYEAPVGKILEHAELHLSSLGPLLNECDVHRAQLWEAHQIETDKLTAMAHELKLRLRGVVDESAANSKRQAEMTDTLRQFLVATTAPVPPKPESMAGKEVRLKEGLPGPRDAAREEAEDCDLLMEDEEVEAMVEAVKGGDMDGNLAVALPPGYHASDEHRESLEKAVEKRNAQNREKERRRFEAETKRFDKRQADYRKAEGSRGASLLQARVEIKAVDTQATCLGEKRTVLQRWLLWVEHEVKLTEVRADGMYTAEMRAHALRGKQIVEGVRSAEALTRLQDELQFAMQERKRAVALPKGARNALERMSLEREKAGIVERVCMDVFRVRTALVEEGRRRKWLYEEELGTAQIELRRLRDLDEGTQERTKAVALVADLFSEVADAQEGVHQARHREVEQHAGSKQPLHAFTLDAPALETLALHERCLGLVMEARKQAQQRERRSVSEHRGLMVAQVPTAPDQWLPQADKARHQEELWALRQRLDASVREMSDEVAVHRRRRADTEAEMVRVRGQAVAAVEGVAAAKEATVTTYERSFEMLKHLIDTQRDELTMEVQRYQRALAELAREYNTVKTSLTAKAEHLELRVKDLSAWLEACRYDLSVETARRAIGDEERKSLTVAWKREVEALRSELVGERMHCARLELWVGAMRQDVKNYTKEIWLRERMLQFQKESNDMQTRALKYDLWRNATGLNKVATDVNSLFLFFAQRLASLAGSRRHYNEALRANGAALVLAAMCRGPRLDLRRFAAKALGLMGWDGYVEQRLLGWDVKRSWDLWLAEVVPKEEDRLRALNLSFLDPAPTAGDVEDKFEAPPGVTLRALIVARRQWALRNARRKEGPNLANMRLLGAHPDVISVLLMLTHEGDMDVVKAAALALSVAAFHEHNNGAMGRMPECVDAMVRLCGSEDDEVQAQAAATLANLGYGHELNQRLIGDAGALETLLDLCCSRDMDVIESSSAALANLVCLHKGNAHRISRVGGIQVLLRLIASAVPANLLDSDQMSEVQANCAEALANLTSNYGEENAAQIHALGVAPLVLLCGSGNLQVRRHAALVLGNVAQSDEHRALIGLRGGIEALFLLCEKDDQVTRANALWALGNLAWQPTNQDRIGRYFSQLARLCESVWLPVQTNAVVCLANSLFYNDKNRARLESLPGGVEGILKLCSGTRSNSAVSLTSSSSTALALRPEAGDPAEDVNKFDDSEAVPLPVQEAALRALVSLSYTDRMSIALGIDMDAMPMLLSNCRWGGRAQVQRYSLMCLMNLVAHDDNKRRLLSCGGVEALVYSAGSDDAEVRELGKAVLDALADLKAVEELRASKAKFGVKGMLEFLVSETADPATKRLAIESLAEQIWLEGSKQNELASSGGLEVVVSLLQTWRVQETRMLLPALWTVRNVTHDHELNKGRVADLGAVDVLLDIASHHMGPAQGAVLESALSALVNVCLGHERNCRHVLKRGLDKLIDVAEGGKLEAATVDQADMEGPAFHWDEALGAAEKQRAIQRRLANMQDARKTNQALATSLLQILGPYNWIVCHNCSKKNFSGSTCSSCGHAISFA